MKTTKKMIDEAREMATACSPLVAKVLNTMADELERLPLADPLAYTLACTYIGCNAASVEISIQDDSGPWYLVTGLQNDYGQQDEVDEAVEYLDSRGLIKRDSKGLVCVLDDMGMSFNCLED